MSEVEVRVSSITKTKVAELEAWLGLAAPSSNHDVDAFIRLAKSHGSLVAIRAVQRAVLEGHQSRAVHRAFEVVREWHGKNWLP